MDPSSSAFPIVAAASSSAAHDHLSSTHAKYVEKEVRRIRGEIACAECRRLKIRCDRTVPCSTCVKRGCGALCPNGTIPPGNGSRFVLAAEDHLHHKISGMEARMRSLEDAIAIIQASESDRPHPLLSTIDRVDEEASESPSFNSESNETASQGLIEALGTLCLDSCGGSRFFGPSGGSESLLMTTDPVFNPQTGSTDPVLEELDPSYLSAEIVYCYQSFPFTPPNVVSSSVQPMIESFLPSIEQAVTLCDIFLEHLSWMFHIVSRHSLLGELIPIVYKQVTAPYGPHDLALLLIVLGIGSLVDLNLPPYNLQAQHYYWLARATLALQPILGAQSIVTVKVLHLMSIYNGMSGKESNLEQSYILLDLAGQVASRIGFYVDPSQWKFEGREAYDRRVYFWNLMAGVLWQSLVTGRPPSLSLSYIRCRIPSPEEEDLFQEGEVPLGFGIWGFKASQACLIPLVKTILASKPPTYERVLELDRSIRDLTLPGPDALAPHSERTAISMRIFVRSHYQALMLMFLHRAHFAQAMTESPENPLSSTYSQSVHAAYSSACIVIQDTIEQFKKKPALCARIWKMWTFAFTAAVIVGTVAARGVHLNMQPPPLQEFEAIHDIFVLASKTSNRAARALSVLQAMLQKARVAHRDYHEQGRLPWTLHSDFEDLSYFGGRTNIIQEPHTIPRSNAEMGQPTEVSSSSNPFPFHATMRRQTPSSLPPGPFRHLPPPLVIPGAEVSISAHSQGQQTSSQFQGLSRTAGWHSPFNDVPPPMLGMPGSAGPISSPSTGRGPSSGGSQEEFAQAAGSGSTLS